MSTQDKFLIIEWIETCGEHKEKKAMVQVPCEEWIRRSSEEIYEKFHKEMEVKEGDGVHCVSCNEELYSEDTEKGNRRLCFYCFFSKRKEFLKKQRESSPQEYGEDLFSNPEFDISRGICGICDRWFSYKAPDELRERRTFIIKYRTCSDCIKKVSYSGDIPDDVAKRIKLGFRDL